MADIEYWLCSFVISRGTGPVLLRNPIFSGDDVNKLMLTVKSLSFNCFVILLVLCLLYKRE